MLSSKHLDVDQQLLHHQWQLKGKTLEEAWELSNKAVAEALDGLPPVKMHCSVLAEEAIHKAINDYRKNAGLSTEGWEFEETDHDELHDAVHGHE